MVYAGFHLPQEERHHPARGDFIGPGTCGADDRIVAEFWADLKRGHDLWRCRRALAAELGTLKTPRGRWAGGKGAA